MTMVPKELTEFRKLYLGFMPSRVVLTANNLGIFDNLQKPKNAKNLASRLRTDLRATEIILDALAGIGLIRKSRDGKYWNGPAARSYLVKGARLYQGDIVRHASNMWESFSALYEVARTGRPARRKEFDHEAFIMGMHNLTVPRTEDLVKAVGLKGVARMLDLGGGPGTNSLAMAKKGVKVTIFDLPETVSVAKKVARRERVKGISFKEGDFHVDDIGSGYDLILLSQIFHAFSSEENIDLLRKCRGALNPGGRVVVQEFPIDETMTAPPHSALFSVNMLVNTEKGRCYTPREMKGWMKETGFSKITVKNLSETVLVEGTAKRR